MAYVKARPDPLVFRVEGINHVVIRESDPRRLAGREIEHRKFLGDRPLRNSLKQVSL